jgi:hypothetical protein
MFLQFNQPPGLEGPVSLHSLTQILGQFSQKRGKECNLPAKIPLNSLQLSDLQHMALFPTIQDLSPNLPGAIVAL